MIEQANKQTGKHTNRQAYKLTHTRYTKNTHMHGNTDTVKPNLQAWRTEASIRSFFHGALRFLNRFGCVSVFCCVLFRTGFTSASEAETPSLPKRRTPEPSAALHSVRPADMRTGSSLISSVRSPVFVIFPQMS